MLCASYSSEIDRYNTRVRCCESIGAEDTIRLLTAARATTFWVESWIGSKSQLHTLPLPNGDDNDVQSRHDRCRSVTDESCDMIADAMQPCFDESDGSSPRVNYVEQPAQVDAVNEYVRDRARCRVLEEQGYNVITVSQDLTESDAEPGTHATNSFQTTIRIIHSFHSTHVMHHRHIQHNSQRHSLAVHACDINTSHISDHSHLQLIE